MSTHATVSLVTTDGKVELIHVQHDGFFESGFGAGGTLLRDYKRYCDVKKLIDLGDLSELPERADLLDGQVIQKDENQKIPCREYASLYDWYKAMPYGNGYDASYNYIFVSGAWYVYSPSRLVSLAYLIATGESGSLDRIEKLHVSRLFCESLEKDTTLSACAKENYFEKEEVRVTLEQDYKLSVSSDAIDRQYPILDRVGYVAMLAKELLNAYKERAEELELPYRKEDVPGLREANRLFDQITAYDRAKSIIDDGKLYFDYFVDLLKLDAVKAKSEGELTEEEKFDVMNELDDLEKLVRNEGENFDGLVVENKKYVRSKIDKLADELPSDTKTLIVKAFENEEDDDTHFRLLYQYRNCVKKHGKEWVSEMDELQHNLMYWKVSVVYERAIVSCREHFLDSIAALPNSKPQN